MGYFQIAAGPKIKGKFPIKTGLTGDDSSFSYTGFQNTLGTVGISIDEEVDARGWQYMPKTTGTSKEVYRMSNAITSGKYASKGALAVYNAAKNDGKGIDTYFMFYMDTFIRRR